MESFFIVLLFSFFNCIFRKRQERLLLIQTQILHRLGITGRAMNSSNMNTFSDEERRLITRVVQRVPSSRTRGIGSGISGVNEISSSEIFAERLQSFYPACSFPNHSDPTLWNQNLDEEMRLYYDINFSRSSQTQTQTEISVVSAKLRLYKYNDPPLSEELPLSNLGTFMSTFYESNYCGIVFYDNYF